MVLSIIAYSLSASAAKGSNTLCHIPFLAQRLKRRWVFFQSPKCSGRDAMGEWRGHGTIVAANKPDGGSPCHR